MNSKIILLAVGACVATLILSIFSVRIFFMSPNGLAKVIKKDPEVFIKALEEAAKSYQKRNAQKSMEDMMKNPLNVKTRGRVFFGNKKAPITIVEFSDFQCPYCQRASDEMKMYIKEYKGKVNVVYRHFPLSFHPFARPAAEYFEAIAMISHAKARSFHDAIFASFSEYARLKDKNTITKKINGLLKKIGVNASSVQANLSKAKRIVDNDLKEGKELNVRGTPAFYINGINTRNINKRVIIDRLLKEL